jgi:predicted O-methyltransferase YrrM
MPSNIIPWTKRRLRSALAAVIKGLGSLAGSERIATIAAEIRRKETTALLTKSFGYCVQAGVFAGMRLPERFSWGPDGDLCPKLLGCYEEELHEPLKALLARRPARIINIGCAEGFYAVGLARLAPAASVVARDIDSTSRAICREMAETNGVAGRMTVEGAVTTAALQADILKDSRTLIVMDCEGAELELLDPSAVPELVSCDIVVECHDFIQPGIVEALRQRFQSSHAIEVIDESARDPNRYPLVREWSSLDRWLAVNENRPAEMRWLVCNARKTFSA